MSKRVLSNLMLFLIITAVLYGIWAIQPPFSEDWDIVETGTLFRLPPLPKTGQEIRYCFNGVYFFPVGPFSLFRPWSLLTAIITTSLLWLAFIKESITIRTGLTLLAALGFPYLAHIGAWNGAASIYTVSFVWMVVWYAVFRKIHHTNTRLALKGVLFFILTFLAASWHEVWLITFAGIVGYFIFDALYSMQKRDERFKLKLLSIHFSVILGWIFAVAFYTQGGPDKFINQRLATPGLFATLFSWPHIISSLLLGTKESLVLIKDSFPILLLILYLKLNKNFKTKLSSDFKLFFTAALGSILYMYVGAFIFGTPDWRTRCLCVPLLALALYAFPQSILIGSFNFTKNVLFVKIIRSCFLIAAVIWLSCNAYFTYIYTNIDYAKWLRYRQMVLEHNLDAMKALGHCALSKGRPKGQVWWDHAWGAQDNRYRLFFGPIDKKVHAAVKAIWDKNANK